MDILRLAFFLLLFFFSFFFFGQPIAYEVVTYATATVVTYATAAVPGSLTQCSGLGIEPVF